MVTCLIFLSSFAKDRLQYIPGTSTGTGTLCCAVLGLIFSFRQATKTNIKIGTVLLIHHENITTTNNLITVAHIPPPQPKPNNYISPKHFSNVIRKPTTSLTRAKSCQVVEKSVRYFASYWQVKADCGELCNMSCGTHRNTV